MRTLLLAGFLLLSGFAESAEVLSHPPLHPTDMPAGRATVAGQALFVDSVKGNDLNAGSKIAPFRTIAQAVRDARPGTTIYLQSGVFRENVYLAHAGRADTPITIRSAPGEKAILDGSLTEFFDNPEAAWEPVTKGALDEYRSRRSYPNLRDVLGSFSDSMIGLQTYHHLKDLRAVGEAFDWEDWTRMDTSDLKPVYLGPGVWYDKETGRIHIRLSPTRLPETATNYRGETDPRKLRLLLAGFSSVPLHLDGVSHVHIQDLTIRGAGYTSIVLDHAQNVSFDNVLVWCGTYGIRASSTGPLSITRCRFHGNVAPWTFRSDGSKRDYPGRPHRNLSRMNTHAILEIESGRESSVYATPQNDNWEIAYSEFTDAHDGVYLGGINTKFHHNLVDGLHDDGIYLSPMYTRHRLDKKAPEIHVYQNHFGTMLTALAFGGTETMTPDRVFVYRNVFDQRGQVPTARPTTRKPEASFSGGKLIGDHGSPPWPELNIYHNTFVMGGSRDAAMASYAASRVVNPRRVFNNVFLHTDRLPGYSPPDAASNAASDGNVFWTLGAAEKLPTNFFDRYRKSEAFTASKKLWPDGSDANSRVVDPLFTKAESGAKIANDYRPQEKSPLKNAGVAIPAQWPDPLRLPAGKPDIGAIPVGGLDAKVGPSAFFVK